MTNEDVNMSRCLKIIVFLLLATNVLGFKSDIVLDDDVDTKYACGKRKCIRKCCPKNEYINVIVNSTFCTTVGTKYNFSNILVYDDNNLDNTVNRTLSEIFYLVPGLYNEEITDKKSNESFVFCDGAYLATDDFMTAHLSEDGILYSEFANSFKRWNPADYFCVDYLVNENDTEAEVKFWAYLSNSNVVKTNDYFTAALLTSCVFLFIVLLVYFLLPELRNLVGLVLMAYVFSLMGAFISLASLQLGHYDVTECLILTCSTYFFFLASFCWMNVMSYDIWWTFRGYAKARPIHRRGEMFKFGMYCIYAFGVPFAMTWFLIIMNKLDFSDKPWIITPQIPMAGCFLEEGQKLVYLYIPMLILILCNWFFFLMTAFNIWRVSRCTAVVNSDAAGNPAAHRNQKNRLMIYLKLSIIMGINWILEVVSFFTPDLQVWKFTDVYNLLIGLAIFLIFVFKKKIYKKLYARYIQKHKGFTGRHTNSSSSNTLESNLSQETPLQNNTIPMLQVNTHPMGKPIKRWN